MTVTINDERQEVTARLRAGGIARTVREAYVLLLHCVGIRPQLPADETYQEALSRIADLIDPTCHGIEEREFDGIGAPPRYISRCSNCGQWWDETDGIPRFPAYCPGCGCRVVRNDGR